jgi:intracellular sulfur oxidation DsrE/DsrF family protein
VLVHLNDNDPAVAFEVLSDLEQMLLDFEQRGEAVQVEVVANGDGLDLVRADLTPIAEEVTKLIERHPNLTVAACRYTIDQLWEDHGVVVDLIPGVKQIDSGVVQVIRRQQEGWAYIRG